MITTPRGVRVPHAAEIAIHVAFRHHAPEVLASLEWSDSVQAFIGVYRHLSVKVTREGVSSIRRFILE